MTTNVKICTAVTIALLISLQSTTASANDRAPLFELARQYEAAVEKFERIVRQVRGIDRADETLVDRLDDESGRLRRAAQNPRYLNKIFYKWQDVQKLHAQVEQKIFGKYTPNHDLIYGWDVVTYRYLLFEDELFYHVENPRHGRTVRRIPTSNARRDRYFGSSTTSASEPVFRTITPPGSPLRGR